MGKPGTGAHGGELDGVGSVRIGQPDFQCPRATRRKGHPAAVGRKLRNVVPSRGGDGDGEADEVAGAPGAEVSTRQILESTKLRT